MKVELAKTTSDNEGGGLGRAVEVCVSLHLENLVSHLANTLSVVLTQNNLGIPSDFRCHKKGKHGARIL